MFSYGSGCCAEFFNGVVGPGAGTVDTGVRRLVAARRAISVAEYEALRGGEEHDRSTPPEGFLGRFYYAGTERDRRQYLPACG